MTTFSYQDIHTLCRNSSDEIKTQYNPDLILAVSGGGLIPARILRTYINVPIVCVSMYSYDDDSNTQRDIIVDQWVDLSQHKNSKILIVDEVDDTRNTLHFLVEKLINEENIESKNLGVFVVHNKIKKKVTDNLNVSYYKEGEEINDVWITYPWDLK